MSSFPALTEVDLDSQHHVACARGPVPDRDAVRALIALTDRMVAELEELNLYDVTRVGTEWRPRLAALFAALPFPFAPYLRAHPCPTEVLDLVFEIQAPLLALHRDHRLGGDGAVDPDSAA
jgi:hypothetical protein